MLDPLPFYDEWSGHPIKMLQTTVKHFRDSQPDTRLIWLAGDSSLDNKFWLKCGGTCPWRDSPKNGWHELLPYMLPDVAYHINTKMLSLEHSQTQYACINTAVEESMLRQRLPKSLLDHDQLIRENISEKDVVVVSIGGNDIAMIPTPKSIAAMLSLVNKSIWKQMGPEGSVELTDQQWEKLESSWQFKHLVKLFGTNVQRYLSMLTEKKKPALLVPCMIYFPQVSIAKKSWANFSLKCLRYSTKPWILQSLIKRLYEKATCQIKVDNVRICPVALYQAMPGTPEDLYVERVEPSISGGEKMATLIVDALKNALHK